VTSWSDNERKGADTLAWLDRNLDFDRYELTFVGRALGDVPATSRSRSTSRSTS
jgi:hypothetical protein